MAFRMMVAAGAVAAMLAGCSTGDGGIAGSGQGGQRSWAVDGFEKVELAGSDDVEVRVGPAFAVRAEGPAAVLDRLRIERDGDTLEIGRKRGDPVEGKARIVVTLPRMTGAGMAGSGTMQVDRVGGARFAVEVAGSGALTLAQVQVDAMSVEIAGSGNVRGRGTTRTLDVDVAGSGGLDAGGLVATAAEVEVAGSGVVRATVNGRAKVSVMGSGTVDLGAGARCDVTRMGSGSVRCGG